MFYQTRHHIFNDSLNLIDVKFFPSWTGNKGVAIAVLQSMLNLTPSSCLHVGDQFLAAGNDFAAREMCPTVWITSPLETQKILEYVSELKIDDHAHTMPGTNGNADPYAGSCGASLPTTLGLKRRRSSISKPSIDVETSRFNVYTGWRTLLFGRKYSLRRARNFSLYVCRRKWTPRCNTVYNITSIAPQAF